MSEDYKYWKFYPTENVSLGSTDADIFEGDYTPSQDDKICQADSAGMMKLYIRLVKQDGSVEWGRYVTKKVGGRIR